MAHNNRRNQGLRKLKRKITNQATINQKKNAQAQSISRRQYRFERSIKIKAA